MEYKGAAEGLEEKAQSLNLELQKIISTDTPTVKEHYSYDEAVEKNIIPK